MNIRNLVQNRLNDVYVAICRFPATVVLAVATSALLILIIEHDFRHISVRVETLSRIAMTCGLGILLTVCIQLLYERYGRVNLVMQWLGWAIGLAILWLYFLLLLPDLNWMSGTRYTAVMLTLVIALTVIPYFIRKAFFEQALIRLSARFLLAILYSAVLFLGISAILFTLQHLLSVPVPERLYLYVWIVIVGVFAPVFFLAGIPQDQKDLGDASYAKWLRVLLINIVLPLIMIYTLILYIYFAKILLTQQWPEGLVSHLVLWYSAISIGVILYTTPLRAELKWAERFAVWFSKLILPLLIMMFVSIGIRINAYGVTENRYFVVALGAWVFGTMCYLAFSRQARNTLIVAALGCITILSVFGPWSAYSLAQSSQNHRLHAILHQYDMIQDGQIVNRDAMVADEDKHEIRQILYYFERKHSFQNVAGLPASFTRQQMEDLFGFPYYSWDSNDRNGDEHFSYSFDPERQVLEISGYDYLFQAYSYRASTGLTYGDLELNIMQSSDRQEAPRLQLARNGSLLYERSILEMIEQMTLPSDGSALQAEEGEGVYIDENDALQLKMIFQHLDGVRHQDTGGMRVDSFRAYVLVRLK